MASRAQSRSKSKRQAAAATSGPDRVARLGRASARGLAALGRGSAHGLMWLVEASRPGRLGRQVFGVVALAAAVLLTLPMLGVADSGTLLASLGNGLAAVLGLGMFLVPLGLVGLAAHCFAPPEDAVRQRRMLGFLLFATALVTLFDLLGAATVERGGGYLGTGLGELTRRVAGEIGAGIIALVVGLLGVYLLAGVEALAVLRARRQLRAERLAAARLAAQAPVADASPIPAARARRGRKPAAAEPAEPIRPVINVPKPEPPAPLVTESHDEVVDDSTEPAPLPDLEALALYTGAAPDEEDLNRKAGLIQETLTDFKVDATVREVCPGPAVTLFTLKPGPGVKVRRITELQNDLALALAAPSIRIEAPVPGMARVGIEIPNSSILTVGLRETIASAAFQRSKAKLPLSLGQDVNGNAIVADLTKMPHLLIAGATGSGKSVCINGIIATFLLTRRPTDLQLVLIDPKMVELIGFNGVPHLKCPVVTEMDKVVGTLKLVLAEMEDRYQRFSSLGVRNIDGYNMRRADDPSLEAMPYLVVVIDELADLMMTTPDEVETLLVRLAQMARATGIHLLIATQRPSVDVLTGLIKTNVPARIAFAVTSQIDSRVILDIPGAERLLGRGDMLYLPPDAAKPQRIQGSFIEDRDLQYIVKHWKRAVPFHRYDPKWIAVPQVSADGADPDDDLLEEALAIVRKQRTASASMLQRRMRIGYNKASRLIERMEEEGYVGPSDGSRGRPVYVDDDDE